VRDWGDIEDGRWARRVRWIRVQDESGHFELPEPGTFAGIGAKATGYAPRCLRFERIHASEPHERLAIRLEPRGSLSGRIVDAEGAPVKDATVFCLLTPSEPNLPVSLPDLVAADAVTGDDGRFDVNVDDGGQLVLVVWHVAYAPTLKRIGPEAKDGKQVEVLMTRGATVAGRVYQEGKPAPGQPVWVAHREVRTQTRPSAETGPDGRYQISLLPVGNARVCWGKKVGDRRVAVTREMALEDGETTVVDFGGVEASALEGMVTLAGKPTKASLIIDIETRSGLFSLSMDTRDDGTFRIADLPTGKCGITAQASERGFHPVSKKATVVLEEGATVRHDFQLRLPCVVEGTVEGLRPGEFASVYFIPGKQSTTLNNKEDLMRIRQSASEASRSAVVFPNSGGTFRRSGLEPGDYTMLVHTQDRGDDSFSFERMRWTTVTVSVKNGKNQVVVELE
jgi:hypothetical protein